jgi:GDPmannose 4,6-dehydratase
VIHTAVQIKKGLQSELRLGNLDARRDWGFARDYVEAMWLMLQQEHGDDFVIGTGETHSVRELCELSFEMLGLDYRDYVVVDESLYRPAEEVQLVADPRKIQEKLGWGPRFSFQETVQMMLDVECQLQSYSKS